MPTFDTLAERLPWLQGRLLAGVSGGADSMALCRLLLCLRDRGHAVFSAVHVNHGLRGDEADADEAFVADFCRRWEIPLLLRHLTPPDHPGEGWARQARYAAFASAMEESGAEALVLAHHRDDQAETLLMHLLRGAGLTGLCGMRTQGQVNGMAVWRPLLDVSREELRAMLAEAGQPWREDASNAGDDYLRNRLRHQLLPAMEALAPGASARLAQTASRLQPEESLLDDLARQALGLPLRPWLPLAVLRGTDARLHPRMLRLWWRAVTGEESLDAAHTRSLAALAETGVGARCALPGGRQGYRGYRFLHLLGEAAPPPQAVTVTGPGAYVLGGAMLQVTPGGQSPGDGVRCQELPGSLAVGCILRTRRTGDSIRPFGMAGEQPLQDYLVNRRVDAPFRDRIPLLCRGSEVLAAGGVGAGGVPRWKREDGWLRLTWTGEMPWMNWPDE